MSVETPKIDSRSLDDIVRQAKSLAQEYVSMSSADYDKFMADQTTNALIQIFARLVRIILQRLNKVPEKNFLAFLDLAGVQLSPPKAARAPLQFVLAEGSTTRGFVPVGTQVATAQTEEQPAVVFETAKNITVITPELVKALSIDPNNDSYSDHSEHLVEDNTGPFDIFKGEDPISHQLILGHDQIFGFKEPSTITLHVDLQKDFTEENAPWQPNDVEWYYYDVDEKRISPTPKDTTNGLTESGDITLKIDKEVLRKTIAGVNKQNSLIKKTNHWIIAELSTPIPSGDLPEIKNITAKIVIAPEKPVNPDMAFSNNIPIDLSKDFYPFGEKPKFNDTFYFASKEAFSKPDAPLEIRMELSKGIKKPDTKYVLLAWEYWDGEKWNNLQVTNLQATSRIVGLYVSNDGNTGNFVRSDGNTFSFMKTDNDITWKLHNPWTGGERLNHACFVNKNDGWAIGDNGAILKYMSGEWEKMTSKTTQALNAIFFTQDGTTGWTVGNNGTILHTEDSGKSWDVQTSNSKENLNGVFCTDGKTCWAVGSNGTILHTRDSGRNWDEQTSGTTEDLNGVFFLEHEYGWVVGNHGTILVTYSGGDPGDAETGWYKLTTDNDIRKNLNGIFGFGGGDDDVWIVGDGGIVLYIAYGGEVLEIQESGISNNLTHIFMTRSGGPVLGWAVGDDGIVLHTNDMGRTWKNQTTEIPQELDSFLDNTINFTQSGSIKFTCPASIAPATINGEENYWLRVRIIDGSYGQEATYQEVTVKGHYVVITKNGEKYKIVDENEILLGDEETEWIYIPPTFKPPSISSLTLTYNFKTPEYHLQHCLTYNNFEYVEHVLLTEDDNEKYYLPFKPFEPVVDKPILYLGFDQNISSLPVTLYFSIMEKIVTALESSSSSEALPTLVWKYWDGVSWTKFDVEDATRSLSERELAQFLAPANMAPRYLFNLLDQQYYWIKVQIERGTYRESPRLRGIQLNTVWAYNRVSIHNEILGSGTEKANQTFVLSQSPVFPGQKLLVREPEAPTGEEREEILQNEGDDAIEEIFDESGNLTEVWVRWHEVANFYASGPGSRDCVIDHVTGTITFGDGINGMIPPRGRDNIKCQEYQYGGGSAGNVAANAISELRTSIPYIDKVSNPEAAEGGAEAETLDEVKERGPQTLKNRDRAVTWEDYEWLVKQVSTAIARVKCLPAKDSKTAGEVKVIVVPDTRDIKPFPNRTLIRQVEDYLYQRGLATLTSGTDPQVRIFGPGYIEISVEATVVPQDINQAPLVESRVRQNLTQFLHPLDGGPEGQGWDFGRDVFISEIYAVIEDTEGVDHVGTEGVDHVGTGGVDHVKPVTLKPSVQINHLILQNHFSSTADIPAGSTVSIVGDGVTWILAEDIPAGTEIENIVVKGFKEMDVVIISHNDNTLKLTIKSVQWDTLFFEPFQTQAGFPGSESDESVISTRDGLLSSLLVEDVNTDQTIESVKVREFKQGDEITINAHGSLYSVGTISTVKKFITQVYIDENYLVYSGSHDITMVPS